MAVPIHYDMDRQRRYLTALRGGRAIDGVKTVHDLFSLASACLYTLLSQSDEVREAVDWDKLPASLRNLHDENLIGDIHAALDYYVNLTMAQESEKESDLPKRAYVAVDGTGLKIVPA